MRFLGSVVMILALAACDPKVPNSGEGVGFDNYEDYEAARTAREAKLRGATAASSSARSTQIPATTTSTASTPPARPANRSIAISDEQDFSAVSARETIQSDRERLAAQRQQYTVIEPTALPTRSGSNGPNIVDYALSTTNAAGMPIYKRSKLFAQSRYNRNCAKFASPDLAQAEFLRAGGPKYDRKGLDPDGDGFACTWDPQPFRNARAAATAAASN